MKNFSKKLVIPLCILVLLCLYEEAFAQSLANVSLFSGERQQPSYTVEQALRQMEKQFNVSFHYETKTVRDIRLEKKIPDYENENLQDALNKLLTPLQLSYRKLSEDYYLILKAAQPEKIQPHKPGTEDEATGQNLHFMPLERKGISSLTEKKLQQTISGKVTDGENGDPLPGVNVLAKGTTIGTVTDIDGNYQLMVEDEVTTLVFSSIGYMVEEIEINGQNTINLEMMPDIQSLSEVVVVGYGTQKKVNLTGAVESLDGRELAKRPVLRASMALQGMAPGVTVTQSSGQPGADGGEIRIRGIGTLGNSDPLVLIDGIAGSLDDIEPNDIENISVLKDAASAAIYGSRGANGVILVTTKRGKSDQLKVSYSGYGGFQRVTDLPNFLGGLDFMNYLNLALANEEKDPTYSQEFIDEWQANVGTDPDRYYDTDWQEEVYTESAFQQQHNVTLSGGTNLINMLGSFTFSDQKGVIKNFNFKRYSFRLNTDLNFSERFRMGIDLNGRQSVQNEPGAGLSGITYQVNRIPPVQPVRFSDGRWGVGWNGDNPRQMAEESGFRRDQYNYFRAVVTADYKPVEGMNLRFAYSPESNDRFYKQFNRVRETYYFDSEEPAFRNPQRSSLSQKNVRVWENNLNLIFTYDKSLGNHQLGFLAGYEQIDYKVDDFGAFRDDFPLEDYTELDAGSISNWNNSGTASEWALRSYFSRLTYNFKGKYLLEANVRHDGSSRFTEGNRYGTFPSFSAGWRISEENLLNNINWLSDLKLRASWGRLGNQNIGTYPSASVVDFGQNYEFGGLPANGAAQIVMSNPDISWETTESSNIGLDLAFWRSKFSMSFDYYVRSTYDILLELPIPGTIGLDAPYQNAGEVENRGWDLALNYSDDVGDFEYNIGFILSDVKNKVTNLVGTGPYIDGQEIIEEGYPIESYFGYKSLGFFQTQEELDNSPQHFLPYGLGDIMYRDQLTVDTNGDGIPDEADGAINADDRIVLGNPIPRYTFSLNLNARYKNFDLTAFFQGVGKRDTYLEGDAVKPFNNGGKIQEWHTDFWTPENRDATFPRLVFSYSNNRQASDFWIYSSAYMRLKTLQLGYTFPEKIIPKSFIQNVRINFTGQNLFTFDKMPAGWDPETPNGNGQDYYPIVGVYTLGLDVTF